MISKYLIMKSIKKYVGVGNELILENLKKLFDKGANIWIRIPIISDVNDSLEEMQNIKMFLDSVGIPQKIELLPYHAMGENKYSALGKECTIFVAPDTDKMTELKQVYKN